MSATEEIYAELIDGLVNGIDYDEVRLKWEKSKGPFYNALQKVFSEIGDELARTLSELHDAKQKAVVFQEEHNALCDKISKAQEELESGEGKKATLEQKVHALESRIRDLDAQLGAKKELLDQVEALDEMGFRQEHLKELHRVLLGIGTKRGLKAKDAVAAFFSDLGDYDAQAGFKCEIKRLETVAQTSKLEAQRWRAEKDAMERAYRDKKGAVIAMEALLRQGVKTEHILTWRKAVEAAGGVDDLAKDLARFKSVKESAAASKKEFRQLSLERSRVTGEVSALIEQKSGLEGAIKTLSGSCLEAIAETKEMASAELMDLILKLREEIEAQSEVKAEAVRIEKELACARLLNASDEVLKAAPKTVMELYLATVARYSRLRGSSPKVELPEPVRWRNPMLVCFAGLPLDDLLEWTQKGVAALDAGLGVTGSFVGERMPDRQERSGSGQW